MEYFHYLPSFPVLICKTCNYGVLPSQNDTHFANKKVHGLSKKEREGDLRGRSAKWIDSRDDMKFDFPTHR